MEVTTRAAAIAHAIAEYPRESCGLVIVSDGVERYWPCVNRATSRADHFIISPEDYANAEDAGEVVAVVHSHPDATAKPSDGDLVSCEATGLRWHIFAIHRDALDEQVKLFAESAFEPSGYEAPLVGRDFCHGVLDCFALVRDYYQRELGIELPDFDRTDEWWSKGQNLYMDNYAKCGFVPVNPDNLQRGDIILMQIRSPVPNHAGVYTGDGLFLQHLYGRKSSRDVYGGYWKEKTVLVIRKES